MPKICLIFCANSLEKIFTLFASLAEFYLNSTYRSKGLPKAANEDLHHINTHQ